MVRICLAIFAILFNFAPLTADVTKYEEELMPST